MRLIPFDPPTYEPEERDRLIAVLAAKGPDAVEARNLLALECAKIVAKVVARVRVRGMEPEDVFQHGFARMLKLLNHYRPDRGMTLASYLFKYLPKEVHDLRVSRARRARLYGQAVPADDGFDVFSVLAAPSQARPYDSDVTATARELAARGLPRREADLVRLRYGLDGGPPLYLREAVTTLRLHALLEPDPDARKVPTRQRLFQIEASALKRLRTAITRRHPSLAQET